MFNVVKQPQHKLRHVTSSSCSSEKQWFPHQPLFSSKTKKSACYFTEIPQYRKSSFLKTLPWWKTSWRSVTKHGHKCYTSYTNIFQISTRFISLQSLTHMHSWWRTFVWNILFLWDFCDDYLTCLLIHLTYYWNTPQLLTGFIFLY